MEQYKWLVSGSRGFLGSGLTAQLERSSQEVIRGDRLCEYVPKVDRVVDLAAYGNTSGHAGDIYEIYRANVMRPINLIKAIQAASPDCKSIIFTSSSSVLIDKQTHYSLSKQLLEKMATKFAEELHLPIVVIRPSTVTGLGEAAARLIPKLIDSCLNGTEMPFVTAPTHDYVDVRDVVSAILLLSQGARGLAGRVFNVSSNVCTTNQEVLEIVEAITGKKANVKLVKSMRPYDNDKWVVDNGEMLKLGWKPEIGLAQSIQGMVEYERQRPAKI